MLDRIIFKNEKILEDKFKIKSELTSYKTYNQNDWKEFLETKKGGNGVEGVFLPRKLTANILTDTKFFETNSNHEYFGHGLFCEYSLIGKELVKKEKELESLEKKILKLDRLPENKKITVEVNDPFVEKYLKNGDEVDEFANQNLYSYEGFAIWMEYFLARNNNNLEMFNKKLNKLDENTKKVFNHFKKFEDLYGEYALLYSLKFPKHYDKKILNNIIKKIYKEDYKNIEFALLYGSKKPYISITDPLFTGDVIIGDNSQINYYKDYVNKIKINDKMIHYNLTRAEQQKRVALCYPEKSKENIIGNGYYKTCKINAKELSEGNKILTLKNIDNTYNPNK